MTVKNFTETVEVRCFVFFVSALMAVTFDCLCIPESSFHPFAVFQAQWVTEDKPCDFSLHSQGVWKMTCLHLKQPAEHSTCPSACLFLGTGIRWTFLFFGTEMWWTFPHLFQAHFVHFTYTGPAVGHSHTADAEIKVPSFKVPELTNVLALKPGVGQNIAMHALPTTRSFFLVEILTLVHSASPPPPKKKILSLILCGLTE